MTDNQLLNDATIAAGASKVTTVAAGSSVVSWFLSSEFGMLAGITIGLIGLCVNWFYRYKQDKREEEEHNRRMAE